MAQWQTAVVFALISVVQIQFLRVLVLHDVFRWFQPLKLDGFTYLNINVRRLKNAGSARQGC